MAELAGHAVVSDASAETDEDGAVSATVQLMGGATLWLHVGDGWNRTLLTTPSRRAYEWPWRSDETPGQLRALLTGNAIERVRGLGPLRVAGTLVIDGRPVAHTGWPRLLTASLPTRERPVLVVQV
ncbi:hypothetical protein OJ997_01030 [Solirubrobacter phytolaccae]|uniref:Uncharacterized protein n=1 Tax=Solirubrobacter phytolaccae TaxID=1404360 RepID=A0A9X3N5J7_9ACTN|nr:hypothetical protein [Solirubrobacter phytolaccae]MDA0178860.1 hypothetical protein [Solirubrobacter phytolaccae]